MKADSWEFLLFDEEIPTVFGFTADMALLRFRQRVEKTRKRSEVEKARKRNEVIEETNTENGK